MNSHGGQEWDQPIWEDHETGRIKCMFRELKCPKDPQKVNYVNFAFWPYYIVLPF